MTIAISTSDTQICLYSRPIMLLSIDMVDLVCEESVIFMQSAVFTATIGTQ